MPKRALELRRASLSLAITVGLVCLGSIVGLCQPIFADPSIQTESYEAFAGLSSVETWDAIDGLDYWAIPREPPTTYYCSTDQSSSELLRASLHNLISPHTAYPYTNSSKPGNANHRVDTWDIVALADAYPDDAAKVLDIYWNHVFDRQYSGSNLCTDKWYQREHAWPKTYGFKKEPRDSRPWENSAWVDCHHLFAAYCRDNRERRDYPYATGDILAAECRPTEPNLGRGGSLGASCNYLLDLVSGGSTDSWQTWMGRRGDVARALLYMAVRYEGDIAREADLTLTDDREKIEDSKNDAFLAGETAYMGLLSTLLQWHIDDPVDDLERRRNTVIYLFQGNRNPFVDHPEWVPVVFGTG